MSQNPASRTLILKPITPNSVQLRVHEDCESSMLRIYFTDKEAHELLGVGLRWRHYDCSPEMTKKCLEGSGYGSEDHEVWFSFTSKGRKHKALTKVRVSVEKERGDVLRFRLSADVQGGFRREDGQPAQVVIKRDEPVFEEARTESIALDTGMETYLLARTAESKQCPWITTGLRELQRQFYGILETETEVFIEDDKADENAPRKSRFEMVLRDPLEQQAQMDVLRELLSMLPKVEVVGGLAPRIDFLKGVRDGLQGFHQELQEKIDAERKARRPQANQGRRGKKRAEADLVDNLLRAAGLNPDDAADESKDEQAQTEPAASEDTTVKPQAAVAQAPTKTGKSFKALMAEKAGKAAKKGEEDATPRTMAEQLKKVAIVAPPTPPIEPVPPAVEPAPILEPSEPASPES